jgi:integrase
MKKRAQNEGSIYQRQGGLWIAQVSIQGHRVSKYFKSQREGLDWLQEMRNQMQAGLTMTGAQMPLSEYLEQWLGTIRASIKSKTLQQYTQIVHGHIVPHLGKLKLKDVRPDQIQALYNLKLDAGTSARTVIIIHAVLHKALKQALKLGMIVRNPTDAVTRPRYRRKEMNTLTDDQARSFLSAALATRYDSLFFLALHTGMRESELLGLKWADLDWNTRHLQVKRQIQRIPGGGLSFAPPKTEAGRRVIDLSHGAIKKLRTQIERVNLNRQIAGDKWQENDLIFPTRIGTTMHPTSMYKDFKALLKQASLPNIRFHDLRHTTATIMLQQGVHPKIVQERLGHADISMTLNTYSHVLPSMQEEAAEKLDEILVPMDISDEIKKIGEQQPTYRPDRKQ